jgi:hypothetical protein
MKLFVIFIHDTARRIRATIAAGFSVKYAPSTLATENFAPNAYPNCENKEMKPGSFITPLFSTTSRYSWSPRR